LKTRLLGAAVLIALAVLFVPMFFSSKPAAPAGDQSVNLAIPQAPDRDLQTKTMSLAPDATGDSTTATTVSPPPPAAPDAAVPSDQLATVNIGSNRPRDVETDPEAGKQTAPTTVTAAAPVVTTAPTVTTGSGASATQPVIPMQTKPTASAAAPKTVPKAATTPPVAAIVEHATPSVAAAAAPVAAHGSYTINLSAYASAAGAANLERHVRALGYAVSSRAITQAGQPRTLVIAGPFDTRTAAEAARLKIVQSVPGVPARLEQDAGHEGVVAAAAPAVAQPVAKSAARSTAPVVASAPTRAGGWAVQLAAVSNQADANALRDKLRANGFDGFVDSVQSGGKQLWRVRAGPQTQRVDAQRVHEQIKAKLGLDGNVVSVP
jgi:DedD protein